MKHPSGTIVHARTRLQGLHMKVVASVQMDDGQTVEAHLPDREMAAILPRSLLAGSSARVPASLVDTLEPIVARMCDNRRVRVWTYRDRRFFSFPSWKSVRFLEEEAPAAAPAGVSGEAGPVTPIR